MHGESAEFFTHILILLGTSTVLITFFYRLKIAPLLAFIIVGATFGPGGLGIVPDTEELTSIAELGLTFLLFILGLEFSLPRLIALRRTVFRMGSAQVILCTAAFFTTLVWWGLPWPSAIIISGGLALSSTAIVSKELSSLGQLNSRHGEIAIGLLLFQDLVAVILLIAVPLLAAQQTGSGENVFVIKDVFITIAESIGLLVLFFLLARFILPNILAEVARHKSDELLVLAALVIVLLSATLTSSIGLSMELGAFIAGMMLGDTRFRHQLEADIRPFRDLLLGLFFITIGMLVDLQLLANYWLQILTAGIFFFIFKGTIIAMIARLSGESWRSALPAGMALAQGGEFLFALMALASRDNLVSQNAASFIISVTIVSMVITPIMIRYGPHWVDSAMLRISSKALTDKSEHPVITQQNKTGHVIILGFGRVGQTIARFLKPLNLDYIVLETDDIRIREATAASEPVFYGDSSRLDILKAAGVDTASIIIISFDDTETARKILHHVRSLNSDVPILTRTRDDSNLDELLSLGSTEVIPETHEASLTLVSHALLMLDVPVQKIHNMIDAARRDRYKMLHGFYHGERVGFLKKNEQHTDIVHAVKLIHGAWCNGKKISELSLPHSVVIGEVQRQNQVFDAEAKPDLILQYNDTVILHGFVDEVDVGEAYLLQGNSLGSWS